jgi:hypothetical protein
LERKKGKVNIYPAVSTYQAKQFGRDVIFLFLCITSYKICVMQTLFNLREANQGRTV